MEISARNQLQGKVRSVLVGNVMAEVVMTVGEHEFVAAITRGSAEAMNLREGDDVIVVVKSTDVMVAKP